MSAFCDSVEAHGGKIVDVVEDDDTINFEREGWKYSAYLDNLRRDVSMGQKLEDAVGHFVGAILSPRGMSDEPSVRNAGLRLILEQEEVLSPFDAIKKPVSQEVALVAPSECLSEVVP